MSTPSDWATKDFYKILGVKKDASADDVKKAYRKLARENHPDSNPNNKAAEERFKDVSEAYSVLGSADKRKQYDEQRSMFGQFKNGFPGGSPGGAGGFPGGTAGADFDIGDLLGGIFGGAGGGSRRRRGAQPRRGDNLESEATIGFRQSVDGATIALQLTSDEACPTCHGTGARPGTAPKVCQKCQGSGMQTGTSGGVFAMTEPCSMCGGRGLRVEDPCPTCTGTGRSPSSRTISVKVPPGVKDGQRIKIRGKGARGEAGAPNGDLYLVVHVEPDRLFGRKGDDLTVTVPVAFDEAALGAQISVPTIDGGTVRLKIPEGTRSGRTFRAKGKGGATAGGGHGDLLVTVEITVPSSLTDEQRRAVEAFRTARGEADPRSQLFADLKR